MEIMKRMMTAAGLAMAVAFGMQAEYTLKIKNGKYPAGVTTESLNGNIPDEAWYKKGWTKEGWTIDNYGTSYSVPLSPSHMKEGSVCENALTLPLLKIEEGEWLIWEGCEVYPLFSDTYTVEIRPTGEGEWTSLGEFTESESTWSLHMLDLGRYQGIEAQVRFVCRSTDGYMLALNEIRIMKPGEHTFSLINRTPKFFGTGELEDGAAMAEITVTNTGLPVEGAVIGIKAEGNTLSTLNHEGMWPTGEKLFFTMPLPLSKDVKTEYQITIEAAGTESQTLGESFAYVTSFKRHLYVDKGTGMWCNNCPTGTLAIERLEETYGDALIVGETHSDDLLDNAPYFSWLKFYAIPYLMLNHIQSTKGENSSNFKDQIFVPTEMEVAVSGLSVNSGGTLTAKARVSTSEAFDATDRTFRIGYVLTRNVAGSENPLYYQKNICTLATDKQYRYLPSRMIYPMCSFPNVTIPSQLATDSDNPAFTGVKGSMPETLAAGETYDCEWDIPLPEGFDSFDGMRLVAFIIDAGNRNIINSTCAYIDEYAGIEEIRDSGAEPMRKGIFSIDGRRMAEDAGPLQPGLYIIDGRKTLVR